MRVLYASFDEVPSFKAASTHILANCRKTAGPFAVGLLTLGPVCLPGFPGFRHRPLALSERNYLRRGERFRALVREYLEREPPDLFHFRGPWEGLAAEDLGMPTVYEVNGLPSIELPYLYRKAGERVLKIFRGWEQRCLDRAAAILCPSERIRSCLLNRYAIPDPDRIRVIPNGYDPTPALPLAETAGESLRAVYLGTLHHWQGILWALRAFAGPGNRYTLDIYAVGARHWLRHAKKRILRHGLQERVRLLPPVDRSRLGATLSQYQVGLAPLLKTERNADQGCCPVKIMDYLAHGLVTVAPDLAVVRALIEHGENGLLYPPNCLQGLSSALREIHELRGELPRLRSKVLASLRRFPTWDEISLRLRETYEAVASARR